VASEHQPDHGKPAAVAADPGEVSFEHPALRQDEEAVRVRSPNETVGLVHEFCNRVGRIFIENFAIFRSGLLRMP
jgi:hypothetical protein